jgi:hypothetical protein
VCERERERDGKELVREWRFLNPELSPNSESAIKMSKMDLVISS